MCVEEEPDITVVHYILKSICHSSFNVSEPKRDLSAKIPEKIRVEFRPKTNIAWQHVQDLSHNPRVRVTVQSDRHLQSLVKYLEQKWKPHRLKFVSF